MKTSNAPFGGIDWGGRFPRHPATLWGIWTPKLPLASQPTRREVRRDLGIVDGSRTVSGSRGRKGR